MDGEINNQQQSPARAVQAPRKMDPRYVWYYYLKQVWQVISLLIVLLFVFGSGAFSVFGDFGIGTLLGIAIGIVAVVLIGFYIWSRLVYHFYRYELRQQEFRKEYGVINKKYASVPYNRIQNVDIDRNLLQRILGLSELKIQTAGEHSGSEGRLPGLSKYTAEELRDQLIEIARNQQQQGQQQGMNSDAV